VLPRDVLRLIKLWLKTPFEERDGDGKRRMVGGKRNATPCGADLFKRNRPVVPKALRIA